MESVLANKIRELITSIEATVANSQTASGMNETTNSDRKQYFLNTPTLNPSGNALFPSVNGKDFSINEAQKSLADLHFTEVEFIRTELWGSIFHGKNAGRSGLERIRVMELESLKGQRDVDRLGRELAILSTIRHPNIVRIISAQRSDDYLFLCTGVCKGGDLGTIMASRKSPLPEKHALHIMSDLLSALVHLHERGISHRNINLDNCLIEEDGGLRLSNFQFAHRRPPGRVEESRTLCGTVRFIAPEVIQGSGSYIPHRVDMWACGVLFFVLLKKDFPFKYDTLTHWKNSPWDENMNLLIDRANMSCSASSLCLLRRLLKPNWVDRIVAQEALDLCANALNRL